MDKDQKEAGLRFMMHFLLHRLLLFFLFLWMTKVNGHTHALFEKEAVKELVTQYLKAFGKYFEVKCHFKKKNKTENVQSRGMMKDAGSKVKLLVWDSFGEANQLIQDMANPNTFTNTVPNDVKETQETVIIANDIGEDPKSPKKKNIIKKIMKKRPKAKIISLDWSEIVSYEATYQTVLPDRRNRIDQKLVENDKTEMYSKETLLDDF